MQNPPVGIGNDTATHAYRTSGTDQQRCVANTQQGRNLHCLSTNIKNSHKLFTFQYLVDLRIEQIYTLGLDTVQLFTLTSVILFRLILN